MAGSDWRVGILTEVVGENVVGADEMRVNSPLGRIRVEVALHHCQHWHLIE